MAQVENLDQLENVVSQGKEVSQEKQVLTELPVHWENEVPKVKQVQLELVERKDGEEQEDLKDFKGAMDPQEKLV